MKHVRTTAVAVLLAATVTAPGLSGFGVASASGQQAAPATRPAMQAGVGSPSGLDRQAAEALAAGDYAGALPLLRRLADLYKDDARKLKAIQEQITAAERNINLGISGPFTNEQRKPIPAPKAGEVMVFENVRDIGNFEYDAEHGGTIPEDVKRLSGTPIRVRGFMIPMDQAETITTFALVPSLFACCFGQPPQIQHTVVVKTPKGKAVSYFPDEIIVEGKLTVEEKKEEGFIVSVFELSASSVKPASH